MTSVIEKYARIATPRYTSYPTAPHFDPSFQEAEYRAWLQQLDPDQAVSLYLHVPFCRQMCWYCGCNMKLVKREGPLRAYVASLKHEINLLSQALPGRMQLAHIHFGGGTPTALSPEQLASIMSLLRETFDIRSDAEIAVESDPRTLTSQMVHRLAEMGFNRASFGVQEFDPKVQQAINRIQPPEMVAAAVDAFRDSGISAINFDLIYGLPHQSVDTLLRTIDQVAIMRPDRVSLFGYAHVPWVAKNQRMIEMDALPGPAARGRQAASAATALEKAGYQPIGIDHFALPDDPLALAAKAGRLHRNFQGYTNDPAPTLLGVGPTSIGRTPWGYVQNHSDTRSWSRDIAVGNLPVGKGLVFQGDDILRGAVIERIMCDGRVDPDAVGKSFGKPAGWWADARAALQEMAADRLVDMSADGISLTAKGAPLARVAAAAFDSYLAQSKARHSASL